MTGLESDRGKFKVPTLRDVSQTPPYFHDGRFETLEEVVDFYNDGGAEGAAVKDILIRPLGLTWGEKAALVAYLKALKSTDLDRAKPVDFVGRPKIVGIDHSVSGVLKLMGSNLGGQTSLQLSRIEGGQSTPVTGDFSVQVLPSNGVVGTMTDLEQIEVTLSSSLESMFASNSMEFTASNQGEELLVSRVQSLSPLDGWDAHVDDSDGDGIDDDWEQFYVGNFSTMDAGSDQDGDGTPDRVEFLLGRNPVDASDFGFEFNRGAGSADSKLDWRNVGWSGTQPLVVNDSSITATTTDGLIIVNDQFSFDASAFDGILMRTRGNQSHRMRMFWHGVSSVAGWGPTIPADEWGYTYFDLSGRSGWSGTITNFRIDAGDVDAGSVEFDFIVGIKGSEDRDGDGISNADELAGDFDGDGIPNILDLDSDGDGAPDSLEHQYSRDHLSADDGIVDSDGDGESDLFEMIAGTDPDVLGDATRFDIDEQLVSGRARLSFMAQSGRRYRIYRSEDLVTWSLVDSVDSVVDGVEMQMVDDGSDVSRPKYFYRLAVEVVQ